MSNFMYSTYRTSVISSNIFSFFKVRFFFLLIMHNIDNTVKNQYIQTLPFFHSVSLKSHIEFTVILRSLGRSNLNIFFFRVNHFFWCLLFMITYNDNDYNSYSIFFYLQLTIIFSNSSKKTTVEQLHTSLSLSVIPDYDLKEYGNIFLYCAN